MNIGIASHHDVERDRQQQARALAADSGADWGDEFRPGSAGCHDL